MFCKPRLSALCLLAMYGSLVACQNNGGSSSSSKKFEASCTVYIGNEVLVCHNVHTDSAASESDCDSEIARYSDLGVYTGYAALTPALSAPCTSLHSAEVMAATCELQDTVLNYYTAFWSSSDAEDDCTSRGGSWD